MVVSGNDSDDRLVLVHPRQRQQPQHRPRQRKKRLRQSRPVPKKQRSPARKVRGKVYGYITPGPDTWYQRNVEGFQMGAEKDGNKVVILNSDYDVSKEVSILIP